MLIHCVLDLLCVLPTPSKQGDREREQSKMKRQVYLSHISKYYFGNHEPGFRVRTCTPCLVVTLQQSLAGDLYNSVGRRRGIKWELKE